MEPSSKTVENISFDAVKKGLRDALESSLDKICLLENDQKNHYQGMGHNRTWDGLNWQWNLC